MMLHGNVYGRLLSTDAETALNLSDIFRRRRGPTPAQVSTNSLLRSYEASSSEAMATTGNDDGGPQSLISGPPSALSGRPDRRISPLQGPLRARVYCDARLKHLEIAYWTKVPVSDEFAASMISVYLENEHPLVGAFDTETFLDDLVTPGLQFCSSFLVNSVLSLASVSAPCSPGTIVLIMLNLSGSNAMLDLTKGPIRFPLHSCMRRRRNGKGLTPQILSQTLLP